MPQVCWTPALREAKRSSVCTAVGTDRPVVVLSPSCPWLLSPQQYAVPSLVSAQAWADPWKERSNVVDVYVGYLRRKLGSDRFETVRGMGYRLKI